MPSETSAPGRRVHIVGGGPVGLMLAALLQTMGDYSIRLYEKRRDYTRTRMVKLDSYLVADPRPPGPVSAGSNGPEITPFPGGLHDCHADQSRLRPERRSLRRPTWRLLPPLAVDARRSRRAQGAGWGLGAAWVGGGIEKAILWELESRGAHRLKDF